MNTHAIVQLKYLSPRRDPLTCPLLREDSIEVEWTKFITERVSSRWSFLRSSAQNRSLIGHSLRSWTVWQLIDGGSSNWSNSIDIDLVNERRWHFSLDFMQRRKDSRGNTMMYRYIYWFLSGRDLPPTLNLLFRYASLGISVEQRLRWTFITTFARAIGEETAHRVRHRCGCIPTVRWGRRCNR